MRKQDGEGPAPALHEALRSPLPLAPCPLPGLWSKRVKVQANWSSQPGRKQIVIERDPVQAPPSSEHFPLKASGFHENPAPLEFFPRLTPGPRGSPARRGWGRTENPSPVGRSLSWENSTVHRSYPLGRQGGQESGASLGSGQETPAASDFAFCLSTLRLCSPGAPPGGAVRLL